MSGSFKFDAIYENEYYLKYQYEDTFTVFSDMTDLCSTLIGKKINLKIKDNTVFVLYNSTIIGHLRTGIIKDMVIDYERKNYPYCACFMGINNSDSLALFHVGFYFPLSKTECKKFSLTGLKRKDQNGDYACDNLVLCNEGDEVTIDYDEESDKYRVCTWLNKEIGTMPVSFNEFVDDFDGAAYAELSEIDYDDENIRATVSVYLLDCRKMKSFLSSEFVSDVVQNEPQENKELEYNNSLKNTKKWLLLVWCILIVLCVIIIVTFVFPDSTEQTEHQKQTSATTSNMTDFEVSVDSLPDRVKTIIQNLNMLKGNSNRIGIDVPVLKFNNTYSCYIDTLYYSFDENDRFISIHISSSASSELKREEELQNEYINLMILLFNDFDSTNSYIRWKKIISGEEYVQENVIINYLKSDDTDILVLLIPNEKIAELS